MRVKIFPGIINNNPITNRFINLFRENDIQYDCTSGDIPVLMYDEKQAFLIQREFNDYYSLYFLKIIFRKDSLVEFLSQNGFNKLEHKFIRSIDEIDQTNFMIKNARSLGNLLYKPFGKKISKKLSVINRNSVPFDFERYESVDDLLVLASKETINNVISEVGYIIHPCPMGDITQLTISGSINSSSEILFAPDALEKKRTQNLNRVTTIYSCNNYLHERNLISSLIKKMNVKNAFFQLSFLEIDNLLYPINWDIKLRGLRGIFKPYFSSLVLHSLNFETELAEEHENEITEHIDYVGS